MEVGRVNLFARFCVASRIFSIFGSSDGFLDVFEKKCFEFCWSHFVGVFLMCPFDVMGDR